MIVVCSHCNETIAAKDINLTTALARCRPCNHVFDVRSQVQGALEPVERRPMLVRPATIRVLEGTPAEPGYRGAYAPSGELVIERRWLSDQTFLMLAFCVFWDGFLFFWYTRPDLTLGAALFPLLHVGVGVYLTYSTLAQLCNKTVIRATSSEISIRHSPLPWTGVKAVAAQDIERLYCETVTRSDEGGKSESFKVNAVLRYGGKLTLLSGLPERDQAVFIERRLEDHLGLSDAPVAGELDD